ncbi:MAG: hypothetical protein MUP98_06095 [Candidatus Aminicenantes bacterium]|nr:hypothetical protein [Candidatus Aminicenantes bacterium]
MVHFPLGNESEDGNRVSFPRWGKRNVIFHHFTERGFVMGIELLTENIDNFWEIAMMGESWRQ